MSEDCKLEVKIHSDDDLVGIVPDPRHVEGFMALSYKGGGYSWIPDDFFCNQRNICYTPGHFYIGKCSGFGLGSFIRFSDPKQSVKIGRYVSGGYETIFMSSGHHEARTISTCEFSSYDKEMQSVSQRKYGGIIVKNDVWFGDECMIMADSTIENGCIIGARSLIPLGFSSEPFGIYVGSPARLKKFRFKQNVMDLLLDISWWDMPYLWIKENNKYFTHDMTGENAVDVLQELKAKKEQWMTEANTSAA